MGVQNIPGRICSTFALGIMVLLLIAGLSLSPLLPIIASSQSVDYIWGYPGTARGNLNPFTAVGVDSVVSGILFSTGLIYISPNGSIVPWAARSWEFRQAGNYTEIYFYTRDNAFWSDGKPLTVDDYIFTWKSIYTPYNRSLDPQGILRYVLVLRRQGIGFSSSLLPGTTPWSSYP